MSYKLVYNISPMSEMMQKFVVISKPDDSRMKQMTASQKVSSTVYWYLCASLWGNTDLVISSVEKQEHKMGEHEICKDIVLQTLELPLYCD